MTKGKRANFNTKQDIIESIERIIEEVEVTEEILAKCSEAIGKNVTKLTSKSRTNFELYAIRDILEEKVEEIEEIEEKVEEIEEVEEEIYSYDSLECLAQDIQQGLEEGVITYIIFKQNENDWAFTMTDDFTEKEDINTIVSTIDEKAFLISGYDSLADYDINTIVSTIERNYNETN